MFYLNLDTKGKTKEIFSTMMGTEIESFSHTIYRSLDLSYVLISLCWNVGATIHIKFYKNGLASRILNRDMELRPNQRMHNFPVLKNIIPVAAFILIFLSIMWPIHSYVRESNNLWYVHVTNQLVVLLVFEFYVFLSLPILDNLKRNLRFIFPDQIFME